jgi:hypothetical protein
MKGRIITVHLLVLAALDIENITYSLTKQATLIRRSTVLSLPLHLVFLVQKTRRQLLQDQDHGLRLGHTSPQCHGHLRTNLEGWEYELRGKAQYG